MILIQFITFPFQIQKNLLYINNIEQIKNFLVKHALVFSGLNNRSINETKKDI